MDFDSIYTGFKLVVNANKTKHIVNHSNQLPSQFMKINVPELLVYVSEFSGKKNPSKLEHGKHFSGLGFSLVLVPPKGKRSLTH